MKVENKQTRLLSLSLTQTNANLTSPSKLYHTSRNTNFQVTLGREEITVCCKEMTYSVNLNITTRVWRRHYLQ